MDNNTELLFIKIALWFIIPIALFALIKPDLAVKICAKMPKWMFFLSKWRNYDWNKMITPKGLVEMRIRALITIILSIIVLVFLYFNA